MKKKKSAKEVKGERRSVEKTGLFLIALIDSILVVNVLECFPIRRVRMGMLGVSVFFLSVFLLVSSDLTESSGCSV